MSIPGKLIRRSKAFLSNALNEWREAYSSDPTIYLVGFSRWKEYIRAYFPGKRFSMLPREITEEQFARYRRGILRKKSATFFIWGDKTPDCIDAFLKAHPVERFYIEDGFLRSVRLGAAKAPARSLCFDSRGHHFDARHPSDLEVLLQTYPFSDGVKARAREGIARLLESRLSKYNQARPRRLTGEAKGGERRVLVIGQVEDDASIRYGCSRAINNNDVVRLAAAENPGARIIYKVHPDVIHRHRPQLSDPAEVAALCEIVDSDLSLPDALEGVDHVYTVTSLGGFEALLRGIRVTTLGCPFYSGWGLTDDRQPNERRTRRLSLEELFAGAYLLYPWYFDPASGERQTFEECLESLSEEVAALR